VWVEVLSRAARLRGDRPVPRAHQVLRGPHVAWQGVPAVWEALARGVALGAGETSGVSGSTLVPEVVTWGALGEIL